MAKGKGSTAVATRPVRNTSLASVSEEARKVIEGLKDTVGTPGGDAILVGQDKQFKLPDGSKHPGPLRLVIVDFVTGRYFYDRVFDPKSPCPPACFAISQKPTNMVPVKDSPVKQSDACTSCPMNEFGSDGAGKACKEMRVLAVIPEDADVDTTVSILKVSPTALKAFDSYVISVGAHLNKAPFQVVTEVTFDPKLDYPSLRFGNPTPAPDDLVAVAYALRDSAKARLMAMPDFSQYTPPAKAGRSSAKTARR
jgi:hypothetical protein